jgi:acyl carrier protein
MSNSILTGLREPSPRDGASSSNGLSTEQQLAHIVADLLGLETIERDDNFFMLGGHSLLGTQLIMRIRECFGVDVSLRSVFANPTVAGISADINRLLAH